MTTILGLIICAMGAYRVYTGEWPHTKILKDVREQEKKEKSLKVFPEKPNES